LGGKQKGYDGASKAANDKANEKCAKFITFRHGYNSLVNWLNVFILCPGFLPGF
jgi:hypothetical protein